MKPYSILEIPNTLPAGSGSGSTDPRVLERLYETGVADIAIVMRLAEVMSGLGAKMNVESALYLVPNHLVD